MPDSDLDEELAAWLRLLVTPRFGRTSARRLLTAFGSPQQVLAASSARRRDVIGAQAAAALDQPPKNFDALCHRTLEWLAHETSTRAIIPLGDARYPSALLETADPPLLLFAQGRLDLLRASSLAIM